MGHPDRMLLKRSRHDEKGDERSVGTIRPPHNKFSPVTRREEAYRGTRERQNVRAHIKMRSSHHFLYVGLLISAFRNQGGHLLASPYQAIEPRRWSHSL